MIDGSHPGLFVTVDGMAGAGKTTTACLLGPYLRDLGYRVHTTAEPSHGALGELARRDTELYRGHSLACLVAADRYHHLETEVRPRLDHGEIVICDRYVASSYVLQQRDGVPWPFIESLNSHADLPDVAIMLIADPNVAAARIATRGAHDRFQAGVNASRTEAVLYAEVASSLAGRGVPILTIDTTHSDAPQVMRQAAQRITEFTRGPRDQASSS